MPNRPRLSMDKVDKGRNRTQAVITTVSPILTPLATLFYHADNMTASLGLLYKSLVMASAAGSLQALKNHVFHGRLWWTSNETRTELIVPPALVRSEILPLSLAAFSVVVGVVARAIGSRDAWMVSLGLTTLGMLALYHLFPTLRARHAHGHRISLSKNGLELTRIDGRTDMIPWKAHPYLKEIRQGYAIIALKGQEDLHYPIDYLPMSMRQLERLLNTFSTRWPAARQTLGTRGPQHRPRRPGTHRGRTDRRLLDLEVDGPSRQSCKYLNRQRILLRSAQHTTATGSTNE